MASRCKFPKCDAEGVKRGNCLKHYQQHFRAVAAGETTWEELETLGLVSPPAQGKRPESDKYEAVIKKARAKAGSK